MKDELYRETILEFEKKRTENEIELNKRRQEIYKRFPRIKEISDELNELGLKLAKAVSTGSQPNKVIKSFREISQKLVDEKKSILRNARLPEDYLENNYDCPVCKDTGMDGRERCACFIKALIRKYYRQSNLVEILKYENFDTFNLNYYDDVKDQNGISPKLNIQNILLRAINFVQNFDKENSNLYFYGPSGLGKTFLSHCIAKDLLEHGYTVIYQTATDLIDTLRVNKFKQTNHDYIANYLYTCDLLIIDDLGTETLTDFANNELFNLLNKRLMEKKKNIISTNLNLKELQERYSTRLTSRIMGNFDFLEFIGDDIRLKKANIL